MLKKLIDTNIFIDRFSNPDLHKEIFLSEGLVYISSIVLMEIRAGAHTREAIHAYNELSNFFRRVNRILTPSIRDFEKAGEIMDTGQGHFPYFLLSPRPLKSARSGSCEEPHRPAADIGGQRHSGV